MNKGKILHVDDDEVVRVLVAEVLKKNGHEVISSDNEENALTIFAHAPESFILVITDFCMPSFGDGASLRRKIGEISAVPVILMSGYAKEIASSKQEIFFDEFIAKPIVFPVLLSVVKKFIM
jgi:DNA-binding NtrC family response regulator